MSVLNPARRALTPLALACFAGGVVAALAGWAPEQVFVTERLGFRPAAQPWLNGLLWVAALVSCALAARLGLALASWLLRAGLLFGTVVVGLLLAGAVGAGLAIFGKTAGFDADQRAAMGIVAVTLGGMGGLMGVAWLRDAGRRR